MQTQSMLTLLTGCLLAMSITACQGQNKKQDALTKKMTADTKPLPVTTVSLPQGQAVATFGNGCFWCTEAVFEGLKGVVSSTSGYSGGFIKNPAYKEVCNGTTGHAEVIQVVYDPAKVSFEKLLAVFFETHDPTKLNRQGADVGTQYRSAVFYHTPEQKQQAEQTIKKLNDAGAFDNKIVTEVTPFANFYAAEDYHQAYFKLNGEQPYCQFVVRPKVEKFRKVFADDLK
jgi:peptide-methionine (S)-S-oxide reductase